MGFDVCVRCALIVVGQTFLFFLLLLFVLLQVWERLDQDEALQSLTSGSALTPANGGCYNYPAGVSESTPTVDPICLLTSARATAEPDFPRLCEWGQLRLRNFGSPRPILPPERQKEQGTKTTVGCFQSQSRDAETEILQSPLKNCFHSEMKWLNHSLLLSSCAQGWHKPFIFFFL